MKLCIDCKYFAVDSDCKVHDYAVCVRVKSPVDGKPYQTCLDERFGGSCGVSAIEFRPKETNQGK